MAISSCGVIADEQGRELTPHGTALFPAACYEENLVRSSIPWHWHDEWEVIVVLQGTAVIAAGAEKYAVRQGACFFINAGVLHAVWGEGAAACRFHSVVFHPRLVGGSLDSLFWQNYVNPLLESPLLKTVCMDGSEAWHAEAARAAETAWQSCSAEPFGYEFEVRSALSQLVLCVSRCHPMAGREPSEKTRRDNERMKAMLRFIQEHYSEPLTVAAVAEQALVSESECLRCFRHIIGTPPIQYLKQLRVQKAAELLVSSHKNIADIGAQCGFQDTSYFIKSFRTQKGCTPREYRDAR